jgi:hypothetical protein
VPLCQDRAELFGEDSVVKIVLVVGPVERMASVGSGSLEAALKIPLSGAKTSFGADSSRSNFIRASGISLHVSARDRDTSPYSNRPADA